MVITAGTLLATLCKVGLISCSKSEVNLSCPKYSVINLEEPAYVFLKILGNFLVVQDVLIEYTAVNILVAGTVIFSFEGQIKVASRKVKKGFYCSTYGANFDINGKDKNIHGQGRLTIKKAASVNREYFEDNQLGFCLTHWKMLRITGIESRFGVIRETDEKTIL